MRVLILLLLGVACACAMHLPQKPADVDFVQRQKNVYELFWLVHQPTVFHPEFYQRARTFNLADRVQDFEDKEAVNHLMQHMMTGILPRGQTFSIYTPKFKHEAILLFRILKSAKTFDTFMDAASWARVNFNEGMFVYCLSVAVLHRPDLKYVKIPPLYEVLPQFFFDEDTMHKAYKIAMGETVPKKTVSGVDVYTIPSNYSQYYHYPSGNHGYKLSYFTEDIGLNYYYFLFTHDFPFWLTSEEINQFKDIRGEYYFFGHKQLLVRYYLERLCHDMGKIDYLDVERPIKYGFHAHMQHIDGERFPTRPDNAMLPVQVHEKLQLLRSIYQRISMAIDAGYILDKTGAKVNLYTPKGLNILGNLIQGNEDSLNKQLYGEADGLLREVLAFPVDKKPYTVPGALQLFSTSIRDPVFFSMYKSMMTAYHHYKKHLPKYTAQNLQFPGVKIDNVNIDKLITYFEPFDALLNNGLYARTEKEARSNLIKARQYRLNHKPFTYTFGVSSNKDTKAMVRIFLGPKYDVYGNEVSVVDSHHDFLEVDQFMVHLKQGTNKIERNSRESVYLVPDEQPSEVFYKKLVDAIETHQPFMHQTQPYGFPERLMLPKGKKEGMPFRFFFCIHEVTKTNEIEIDSPVWGKSVFDGRAMGFPFDREFDHDVLNLPNMYHTDVVIYHKQMEELNIPA